MLGDDLEYFLALAATGTFTGTAGNLGISQPALSKAVQRLERKVGARLVTRTPRGAELTEAGRAFHARLRAASRDGRGTEKAASDSMRPFLFRGYPAGYYGTVIEEGCAVGRKMP